MELRALGVGCYMGGAWTGAAGYADDIILLAPSRSAMVAMLATCEDYARRHNITFSTDDDPKKSKTKVIYMNGNMENTMYPAPLKLNGKDLPYVKTATHLGHELSQACNLEFDMKVRRAQYIDRTTDIRDSFEFAHPEQKLKAINVYCGDNYGTMIWPLDSDSAGKYFRCWNRCVKLCWDVPESTHILFVEHLLGVEFTSLRVNVLSRYVKFFQSLLHHSLSLIHI